MGATFEKITINYCKPISIQSKFPLTHIEAGRVFDVYDHPDQINYPSQKIYVVEALDYVYAAKEFLSKSKNVTIRLSVSVRVNGWYFIIKAQTFLK